jgi:hypothetical protein
VPNNDFILKKNPLQQLKIIISEISEIYWKNQNFVIFPSVVIS